MKKETKIIPQKENQNKKQFWLIGIAILIFTFILYAPTLDYGFNAIDDASYVTQNAIIQHPDATIWTSYVVQHYHPLTILSLTFDYMVNGDNPATYHRTNLLLHLLNTILVLCLLLKFSKNQLISGFGALLFAIHPLHIESVVWISERKDLLYSFFFLSSLLCYTNFIERKKMSLLLFSFLLFAMSLLSKSMAVSLPLMLLLIDYYYDRKIDLKLILEKIPFFISAAVIAFVATRSESDALNDFLSNNTFGLRPFFISYSFFFYFIKLIIPFQLSFFYPYPIKQIPIEIYLSPIFIATLLFVIYRFRKKKEIVFGVVFFIVCLLPIIPFKPFGSAIVAERYSYVASLGIFFLFASLLFPLLKSAKKQWLIFGSIIYVLFISYSSYGRITEWADNRTLLLSAENSHPSVFVKNVLSNLYTANGNLDSARLFSTAAINEMPQLAYSYFTRAHCSGSNLNNGLVDIDKAIQLDSKYAVAYVFKGLILLQKGKEDSAKQIIEKGISIRPIPDGYLLLGELCEKYGKKDSAVYYFKRTLQLDPTNTMAHQKLDVILGQQ